MNVYENPAIPLELRTALADASLKKSAAVFAIDLEQARLSREGVDVFSWAAYLDALHRADFRAGAEVDKAKRDIIQALYPN